MGFHSVIIILKNFKSKQLNLSFHIITQIKETGGIFQKQRIYIMGFQKRKMINSENSQRNIQSETILTFDKLFFNQLFYNNSFSQDNFIIYINMMSQAQSIAHEHQEVKRKQQRLIIKKRSRMQDPNCLMLLLPSFMTVSKRKKLQNYFQILPEHFQQGSSEVDSLMKERKFLEDLKKQKLWDLFLEISIFNLLKKDWGLKIKLLNKIYYSPYFKLLFVVYKEEKEGMKKAEEDQTALQKLFLILNQYFCPMTEAEQDINNFLKQFQGKMRYIEMFIKFQEKFGYPLHPIFRAIKIFSLNYRNLSQSSGINNTFEIHEAFSSIGLTENKEEESLIFEPYKTKNRFKFQELRQKQSKQNEKLYRFESILSKIEIDKTAKDENGKKKELVVPQDTIFLEYLQKPVTEIYEYEQIRMSKREQKYSRVQSIFFRFTFPINYYILSEQDEREKEYILQKDWKQFLRKLKKLLFVEFLCERIINEYKMSQEQRKQKQEKTIKKLCSLQGDIQKEKQKIGQIFHDDKEDEMALVQRRIKIMDLDKFVKNIELYHILENF